MRVQTCVCAHIQTCLRVFHTFMGGMYSCLARKERYDYQKDHRILYPIFVYTKFIDMPGTQLDVQSSA